MSELLKSKAQLVTCATLFLALSAVAGALAPQPAGAQSFSAPGGPVTRYPSAPLSLRPQYYGRLHLTGSAASLGAATDLTLTTADNNIDSGGQLYMDGGELVLQGGARLAHNGTITVGAYAPAGTVSKIVLRAGSTLAGSGTINVLNGNVLEVIGDSGGGTLAARTINNGGTVKWGGSSQVSAGSNLTFKNYGTLILNSQSGASGVAWHRSPTRPARLSNVSYLLTQATTSDGLAQFYNYGTITGVGSIPGDLTNYGAITPLQVAAGFADSTDGTTTSAPLPAAHAQYAAFQPGRNQSLISFPGSNDDYDNATVQQVQYYNPNPNAGLIIIEGNLELSSGILNEAINSSSYGCVAVGSRVYIQNGATINISLSGFTSPQVFPAPANIFTILMCNVLGSPAGTMTQFTNFSPSPNVAPTYTAGPYPATSPYEYQLNWPRYPN